MAISMARARFSSSGPAPLVIYCLGSSFLALNRPAFPLLAQFLSVPELSRGKSKRFAEQPPSFIKPYPYRRLPTYKAAGSRPAPCHHPRNNAQNASLDVGLVGPVASSATSK